MDIIDNVIKSVKNAGVDCFKEYGSERVSKNRGVIHAYAGIKSIRMEQLHGGLSDVTARVRVTVQAFGRCGGEVSKAAEKTVIPAVLGCGEEIFCAELSEVFYDVKTDKVCCEILFEVRRCGYDICS